MVPAYPVRFFRGAIVVALGIVLVGSMSAAPSQVRRETFTKKLTFTGRLRALHTIRVSPPNITSKWSFAISYLAPEGALVEPGDLLVQFDDTELESKRLEHEKQREDARIKVAQKEADLRVERSDLLLSLAEARKTHRVAQLYAAIDPGLIAQSEADQYAFDASKARLEYEKAQERLENQEKSGQSDLSVVNLEYERASLELRRVESEIERMTVRAERPGLVLYGLNNEGRKLRLGDTVFRRMPIVYLPDMSTLVVSATVFDSDFRLLEPGAEAVITLDALPGRTFKARLHFLPESARPIHRRSELNVFTVDFLLVDNDQSLMKPGMTARVQMDLDSPDQLVVDRAAIQMSRDGGTFVLSQAGARIDCRVVDTNDQLAVVEGALSEGQSVFVPESGERASAHKATWIRVKREDVRFEVSGTGLLKARQSVRFRAPPLPRSWQFKIISMAPEGSEVAAGDVVLEFDPTEVQKTLDQEQSHLETVREEQNRTQTNLRLRRHDLELELEEAQVQAEKASNKWAQARKFESGLSIKETEYEADLASRRVELLEEKLGATDVATELQLHILRETENLHRGRIALARRGIESLTVQAPAPGVVIYVPNWNNEKKQVGSQVNLMESVLSIPNLSTIMVQGQIAESDSHRIRVGQPVSVNLDAIPDQSFSGSITSIGEFFRAVSDDRPVRVLDVEIALDSVDTRRMRPEMVARVKVKVDEFRDVLVVPLSVVESEGDQPYVWVRSGGERRERRPIQLGRDNGIVAVVEAGLTQGEEVLARTGNEALRDAS